MERPLTQVRFRSDVTVELRDHMGSESSIAETARLSTKGSDAIDSPATKGLIKALFREGHGTPFESCEFRFYFEIPIFVSRQIVKHRLTSINEASGRYKQMEGEFYLPPQGRPMQQVGRTMDYEFVEGPPELYEAVVRVNKTMAEAGWQNYQALLNMGVAKEVARMHLPTTLYSQMSFKCNLRSVLNFITLRYSWGKDAALPSHPQYEVALVADEMVKIVSEMYPTVWEAYVESGYRKL